MAKKLMQFSTGRIWLVDDDGHFEGIVSLKDVDLSEYEHDADAIIEAIGYGVGSVSYRMLGDKADFTAFYDGDEQVLELSHFANDAKLQLAFMEQNGFNVGTLQHILGSMDCEYADESIITTADGRRIHTPAHPEECSYVRVTYNGFEIAFWESEEWREAPAEVMGAIMGAAHGPA